MLVWGGRPKHTIIWLHLLSLPDAPHHHGCRVKDIRKGPQGLGLIKSRHRLAQGREPWQIALSSTEVRCSQRQAHH